MRNPWKTVRVVVEVPVQDVKGYEYSAKDLAWGVQRALTGKTLDRNIYAKENQPRFGKLEVKQFNKVVSATTKPPLYA